ncbi:unnamed protein product [Amaranthus hypochondriacus]
MAGNKSFDVMLFAVIFIVLFGTIHCKIIDSNSEFSEVYPTQAHECFNIPTGNCNAKTCGAFYCKNLKYKCVGYTLCCCH